MRFYTKEECKEWLGGRSRELPTQTNSDRTITLWYPPNPAEIDFLWLVQEISYREPVLLWVTEWGIWPSSENWHLYHRIRQSYGDSRLLHEAPGHLFQNFEMEDLATFLQVAATNGWGGFVLPSAHYASFFFSHDEYIDIFSSNRSTITAVEQRLGHLMRSPSEFHSTGGRERISADGVSLSPEEVHGKSQEAHNEAMPNAHIRAEVGVKDEI